LLEQGLQGNLEVFGTAERGHDDRYRRCHANASMDVAIPDRLSYSPSSMSRGEEARRFYEAAYSKGIDGETHGRWRDLTAIPKADEGLELARAAGLQVSPIAEIGCGDGAVLERLSTRRFGRERVGYDIVETA